jgi:hypothetical protein
VSLNTLQLRAQLPPPDDEQLLALLTHQYIRERKQGIAQTDELLPRGERSSELLAVLKEIAQADVIESVRQAAQSVLDRTKQQTPSASSSSEARHMVGVRCPNGHVTYFDKRVICAADGTISRLRMQRAEGVFWGGPEGTPAPSPA